MRKSPASVATLRSRLRATHSILEELVIIKVAANGVRTSEVLKAINVLEKNASLGFENINICPGLVRLKSGIEKDSNYKDRLSPADQDSTLPELTKKNAAKLTMLKNAA